MCRYEASRSDPLTTARRVNTGSYRFVRLRGTLSNVLKIRCPLTKSGSLPDGKQGSIKGPKSVPVSPSSAVECYPCREVPLNYNRSPLFHGGDTGSTPVRDANFLSIFAISTDIKQIKRFLMDLTMLKSSKN